VASVGTTLTRVPVLVVLDSSSIEYGRTAPDGVDLLFTSDAGDPIPYEIESWDPAGESYVWIQIDTLPASGDASIIMRYDNAGATSSLEDPALLWADYEGVWHFQSTPQDTADGLPDSTGAHHGTPANGWSSSQLDTGLAGPAWRFDGTTKSVEVGDPADGSLDFGQNEPFSVSVWVNVTTSAGSFDMPLYKGGSSANTAGYDMELGTGAWRVNVGDGAGNSQADFGTEAEFTGAWVYLVHTMDNQSLARLYADSVNVLNLGIIGLGSLETDEPLLFSRPEFPMQGLVDEIRIQRRRILPEWIAFQNRTMRNDNVVSFGVPADDPFTLP
jgi:hypothetical protein